MSKKTLTAEQNALARELVSELVAKLKRDGVSHVQKTAEKILGTDQSRISLLASANSTTGTSQSVLINAGRALGRLPEVMAALGLPSVDGEDLRPKEPAPAAFSLAYWLSRNLDADLAEEAAKDPARWNLKIVTIAQGERSKSDKGKTPLQRLEHAEYLLKHGRMKDAEGVDEILRREYAAKNPEKKKRKPKHNA